MTYDHDAVIVTLASRASDQVRDGLAALQAGKLLEAEVLLRAAHATLSSLAILLEKPELVKPFRKLAIVGGDPHRVRCVSCGHEWESRLPSGEVPKQCGVCLGKRDAGNGESMIVEADPMPNWFGRTSGGDDGNGAA